MESLETATGTRTPFGAKVRTLVIGVLATTALSIPAVTAMGVAGHDAFARHDHGGVSSDSQRLALTVSPASVRRT
jgi:hypothetical protein